MRWALQQGPLTLDIPNQTKHVHNRANKGTKDHATDTHTHTHAKKQRKDQAKPPNPESPQNPNAQQRAYAPMFLLGYTWEPLEQGMSATPPTAPTNRLAFRKPSGTTMRTLPDKPSDPISRIGVPNSTHALKWPL